MAEYNRYRTTPEDVARRGRKRRQGTAVRKRRRYLWLKIFAVLVVLLVIAVFGVAAGAIFGLSRNLPSLDQLEKRQNAVTPPSTTATVSSSPNSTALRTACSCAATRSPRS